MNVSQWKAKNRIKRMRNRLRHPPPFYKRVGGISAVVIRANGNRENLGDVSDVYAKRWGVGAGQG